MNADAQFWDGLAEKYASQPLENPTAFDRKIALTRQNMKATDVVLNVGCGTGSLCLRLADVGAELHGLDVSGEMVRIAREKATAQGVTNVTFHTGPFDASFTTFAPNSLDGVCAFSILHLLAERRAALAQLYSLLKPGGFFVSSTLCIGGSWIPYSAVLTVMRWIGKAPLVGVFTQDTLLAEVSAAGFVDVTTPDVGAKDTVAFVIARKPL